MASKLTTGIDKQIAERVRFFRRQAGMSQSDLANQLGVTFQQVQKYEKGQNRIGAGRLFEIARIFNVQVQAFFPAAPESCADGDSFPVETRYISEFAASAEGYKLVHSFVQLPHAQKRKITALVQELSNGQVQTGAQPEATQTDDHTATAQPSAQTA